MMPSRISRKSAPYLVKVGTGRGWAEYQRTNNRQAVMALETSRMASAYPLRLSRTTPITLKTNATGGQNSRRDFAQIPSGLPHPGRRMSISGMATPRTAKIFAAVLP